MALTDKLSAIGDAIREKAGTTELMTLDEMPVAIGAIKTGGGIPEEAFIITGDCRYKFSGDNWNWFVEGYGDKITTENISNVSNMFSNNTTLTNIPFDINTSSSCLQFGSMFSGTEKLTTPPNIYAPSVGNKVDIGNIFNNAYGVREIPYDFFTKMSDKASWETERTKDAIRRSMFYNCYSLRKLPDLSVVMNSSVSTNMLYRSMCYGCHTLDEIVNLPVSNLKAIANSSVLIDGFRNCHRLKTLTFETNEDGTPLVAQWKNQMIELQYYVGYAQYENYVLGFNSGITKDKKVSDDASYQALKDDPDWFTTEIAYSRYNHDSAVATINSLPDTSAYLATAGGTNTIKFKSNSGSGTDGGSTSDLTAEEIAVAAAKGWTVSFVS